jgi:cytoskeletal protein RodZ
MMAGVVACPVCGRRLLPTEAACSECGAVLALRVPDGARRRLAAAVRPHVDVARRRLAAAVTPRVDRLYGRMRSIVTAALTTLAQRRRTGLAVAALVITLAMFAVLVAAVFSPRNIAAPGLATTTGESRATTRTQPAPQPSAVEPSRAPSAAPPAIPRPAVGLDTPMTLAMAATAIGAVVGTIAVVSRRRRALRLSWIVNSAAVAAAFCFGLAVALLVVATVERQRMFASAVPTVGGGQSPAAWQREASTRPRDPVERDESRAVTMISTSPPEEAAATVSTAETAARPSTADVLRPPRVAAVNLSERVWDDIVRDWERVKRTVRDLVRPN